MTARITIRIDEDLIRRLRQRATKDSVSVTRLVNEAIRNSLGPPKPRQKKPYVEKTYDMGKPLIDISKANAIALALEDMETLIRMSRRK